MHYKEVKGILSAQNGMNVYRGCTHGCIYCDSRSTCYQINHKFEDIEVKINAPELLRAALISKRKKCMIGTGSMCDPYMQCEETEQITRKCIEIVKQYGFGFTAITKSCRIMRDIDLLESINTNAKCVVQMTLTTADDSLCRIIEPNVNTTSERVCTLKEFAKRNIPSVVWFTPLLPYINDTEKNVRQIVEYCAESGVKRIIFYGAGLTLRDGNREYFYNSLDKYFPGIKQKYINKFGNSYEVMSEKNSVLSDLFNTLCDKYGILHSNNEIFAYLHEFEVKNKVSQISFSDFN